MFGLLSTLAEMLASYGQRLFDGRRARRDIEVAAELVDVVVALQDLAVRGERLLALADSFVAGAADPGAVRTFGELLDAQLAALARLGERLRGSAALLATVDPAFGMDLAILLDGKSGLLTRWQQQMGQSRFSTTTLFLLPADAVREVFDVGRTQIDATGLDTERTEYVAASLSSNATRSASKGCRTVGLVTPSGPRAPERCATCARCRRSGRPRFGPGSTPPAPRSAGSASSASACSPRPSRPWEHRRSPASGADSCGPDRELPGPARPAVEPRVPRAHPDSRQRIAAHPGRDEGHPVQAELPGQLLRVEHHPLE